MKSFYGPSYQEAAARAAKLFDGEKQAVLIKIAEGEKGHTIGWSTEYSINGYTIRFEAIGEGEVLINFI